MFGALGYQILVEWGRESYVWCPRIPDIGRMGS
jgi:hypothetical protein